MTIPKRNVSINADVVECMFDIINILFVTPMAKIDPHYCKELPNTLFRKIPAIGKLNALIEKDFFDIKDNESENVKETLLNEALSEAISNLSDILLKNKIDNKGFLWDMLDGKEFNAEKQELLRNQGVAISFLKH